MTETAQGHAELPDFYDPRVQIVYRILCDTDTETPEGEHWEGFLARRSIKELFPPVAAHGAGALRAELAAVKRERDNLQARLTARAKSMNTLRLRLASVHDHIEDEGDRAYFGSTNDADTFKEVWQDLDAWEWDDIMQDGKLPDIYELSRQAHTRAEAADAEVARLTAEIDLLQAWVFEQRTDLKPIDPEFHAKYDILRTVGKKIRDMKSARSLTATKGG